jgi:hypothetical protein
MAVHVSSIDIFIHEISQLQSNSYWHSDNKRASGPEQDMLWMSRYGITIYVRLVLTIEAS